MNINNSNLYQRICAFLKVSYACGEHRIVLVLGFLGIVIKFPKSKRGNRYNFGEWWFWKKHHHPFCQPCLFCFRLPNLKQNEKIWVVIQQIGYRPCKSDPEEFNIKCSILSRRATESDGHHFEQPSNFFFNKAGRLVMADYGSVQTQRVIKAYGQKIHTDFNENIRCTFDDLVKLIETLDGIRLDYEQEH